ncbi:MAG: SoxR reducing system RseC family protein [Candidatus Eisenbacteria bacterium]|uniref:SoxR reducing system RseC family protein n=1 Tax=Eiseniibacteriota bacterium TaxID=2212470 RepID=A0A956SFQ1_UNCEI|nr:SoxR reducing system RseC family protein [Candidatus Eisenbacteria bacterium]
MSVNPAMIVRVDEDYVEVRVPKSDHGCGLCVSKAACRFLGPESAYVRYRVHRPAEMTDLRPGERVGLELPDIGQNLSSVIIFVLPMLLLFAGIALVGRHPSVGTVASVASGGVVVYLTALVLGNRWVKRSPRLQPRIHRRPVGLERGTTEPSGRL